MKRERLPDGTKFGPYTVKGLVGRGGMGQVYAARDTVYGTTVAIKVLHAELHADDGWQSRFNHEGLVGTQLKHPHLLSARELVESDGRIALVLDLVSGGQTLDKVVYREHRRGVERVAALQVFLRILQGIDYLHGKGIVHGDIKPENILLQGDYRRPGTWVPKVTDFGTVALIADPVQIDGRPAVVATPRYASPEHMLGVDRLEPRSDIYCLGLILHFLLTGQHASNATNVREAAERTMLPVPIVALVDQPEGVIEVFKRATQRPAESRYPHVREFAMAVRDLLTAEGAPLDVGEVDVRQVLETEEVGNRASQLAALRGSGPAASAPQPSRLAAPRDVQPVAPTLDEPEASPQRTQEPVRPISRAGRAHAHGAPVVGPPPLVWVAGVVAVVLIVAIVVAGL